MNWRPVIAKYHLIMEASRKITFSLWNLKKIASHGHILFAGGILITAFVTKMGPQLDLFKFWENIRSILKSSDPHKLMQILHSDPNLKDLMIFSDPQSDHEQVCLHVNPYPLLDTNDDKHIDIDECLIQKTKKKELKLTQGCILLSMILLLASFGRCRRFHATSWIDMQIRVHCMYKRLKQRLLRGHWERARCVCVCVCKRVESFSCLWKHCYTQIGAGEESFPMGWRVIGEGEKRESGEGLP